MKTNPTLRRWCAARFFALLFFPVCALAFHPPEGARLDDFDGRGAAAPAAKNAAAEAALATAAPGVRVDRDRVTGGAAFVAADGIMLNEAAAGARRGGGGAGGSREGGAGFS